jgi:heptosyltransferase III
MALSDNRRAPFPGIRRILMVHQRRLGDIVMATPVIRLIRKTYPESRIAFVCEANYSSVAALIPEIDETITLPDLAGLWPVAWWRRRAFGLARRKEGYDLAVDMRCSRDTAVVTRLSGAAVRVGRPWKDHVTAYTHLAEPGEMPADMHMRDFLLLTARAAGCATEGEDVTPRLEVNAAGKESAKKRAEALTGGKPYAVFQVGSTRGYKCWPLERFAALADKLAAEHGLAVLVHAGPGEGEIAAAATAGARTRPAVYESRDIAELAGVLAGAKVVIGNDSGPMHVAAAVGAPVVVFFAVESPARWGPVGTRAIALRSPRAEEPKAVRETLMADITVAQASEAAAGLLAGGEGHHL